jgi:MFS transporter, putative metabolite:H+ symporter
MKSLGLSFHHPIAFWIGCAALVAGVLAHIPMFIHSSYMDYQMVGMPMDTNMLVGMVLIPVGLLFAAYGLMPRLTQMARTMHAGDALQFHVADSVPLNREHWKLVFVLIVALAVDVMKPATLGFVMPGITNEYEITKQSAGWLALVALTGTTVGSIVWGRMADAFGRRAAILLSALMFIGTAICGAMPTFEWNLVMCFLMGASAGGLLPITFTLMAEMVPALHRGWLLVALGGIGTSAGYLIAAGSAAILEPMFSWRVLWLLGLPTGALIIFLDRYIPESPRFLANAGLEIEARAVLAKYSGMATSDANVVSADAEPARDQAKIGMLNLLRGPYATITYGLIACGIAWGLVNFGFLLWLPSNLGSMGMDSKAASALIAKSAVFALPGILMVIWLYHRWSSVKTLVLFISLTTGALLLFFVLAFAGIKSSTLIILATTCLLISSSGVIAMLIPYAAEIYPVELRGTGSGVVAASSKLGGILGAAAGVVGILGNVALSALLIAVPMIISALMLIRSGIDTRGRRLEEIEVAILERFKQSAGAKSEAGIAK